MKELLNQLLIAAMTVCIPIITAYASGWIRRAAESVAAKTENIKAQGYIREIADAISAAVGCTSQTYVDSLKNSGAFTAEAQKEAFRKSYDSAVKCLSPAAAAFIEEIYGDVGEYITQRIEAEVRRQKNESPAALPLIDFEPKIIQGSE